MYQARQTFAKQRLEIRGRIPIMRSSDHRVYCWNLDHYEGASRIRWNSRRIPLVGQNSRSCSKLSSVITRDSSCKNRLPLEVKSGKSQSSYLQIRFRWKNFFSRKGKFFPGILQVSKRIVFRSCEAVIIASTAGTFSKYAALS